MSSTGGEGAMTRRKQSWLEQYIAAANALARVPDALQGGRSRRNVVESRIRNELVDLAHQAAGRGLNWGTAGSLSARLGTHQILVCPAGRSLEALTFDDLVLARLDEPSPHGVLPEAWSWHLAIYAAQSEARAVLHLQPPFATALSAQEQFELPAVPELAAYWGQIPWVDASGTIEEVASRLAQAARSRLFLVRSRGVLCWGASTPELLSCSTTVEAAARIILLSRLVHVR